MTGLLGYGGAYKAIHDADLLLLLGTDFPFSEFLPDHKVKKVQIDRNAKHIGRRTAVDLALVGEVASRTKPSTIRPSRIAIDIVMHERRSLRVLGTGVACRYAFHAIMSTNNYVFAVHGKR